jgi:uncharacterized membrane protein YccC
MTVDLLQKGKAALAGVLAWVVAINVLGLEQPFLAPWAAVLVVHSTVYRTISRGGQQVAATFAGVLLGWGCAELLGVGPLGMGTMLVAAFVLGRHPWLRDEATTIATTGIVVLATNAVSESNLLSSRLLDTTVGIVVGLLVNLLVWPPLRDRAAWTRADDLPQEVADVLTEMAAGLGPNLEADGVEEWVAKLREVDVRIDEAWRLLGQARESSRMNPRRSRPAGLEDLRRTLHLLEQAVADTLSMARTLATSAQNATTWDERFRSSWKHLLEETAEAVGNHDEDRLLEVRSELGHLADQLSGDPLAGAAWLEYGGLLVNLRNVVNALIEVTGSSTRSAISARRSKRFQVPDKLPRVRRNIRTARTRPRLRHRSGGTRSPRSAPLPERHRPGGTS